MLDWLALWEVDPWGPDRDDRRAAVQSAWNRGVSFTAIKMEYPHLGSGDEDDEDLIAMLEADREQSNGSQTRTTEPEDNG